MDMARFGAPREAVTERFTHRCAVCGCKEGLHIHHRDGSARGREPNNDPDNLLVLCASHHQVVHRLAEGYRRLHHVA
jgi:predicted restriction endonuclease